MVTPTDPNEVRLTGENSFVRLAEQEGGPFTTRASHWRVWLSPAGPGHVLFLQSELTDGEVRIYADNIALARWLQGEIEGSINPDNGNTSLPVVEAEFSRDGDVRSFWTEYVEAGESDVTLTWYEFGDPFVLRVEAGTRDSGPHGVYSTFVPARQARVTVDGAQAAGQAQPQEVYGRSSSTASLALSETWVRPR